MGGVDDLLAAARVLEQAAAGVPAALRGVVSKGAVNVKRDWRANARASAGRHAPYYPASIGYDLSRIPGGATAVVGPDKERKQGALGNLLEYGSVKNPPHNDGGRALAAEEPRMVAAVEAAVEQLMRDL
jgi:hypothetical protein